MPIQLQGPTVGPIVGHTDSVHCRIFFRGDHSKDSDLGRCVGVARCRARGQASWEPTIVNKLSPNFDLTGVFVFLGLAPATDYEYNVGWFVADGPLESALVDTDDLLWGDQPDGTFTTQPEVPTARSYIIGSCRYLLRLFGGAWFDDRGDKVFRSILEQIEGASTGQRRPVDTLMMMGDQIYADDLNSVLPDVRLEQFLTRYRTAFSQEYLGRLMSRVPTYMILDDHEIEDNWPAHASEKDRLTLYPHAIHAYQIYQCSHGPLFKSTGDGRIDSTLTRFWYTFNDAVADWFVLDTRTERSPAEGRMIGAAQMLALVDWLKDGSGRIKFIVSSVPMFPDLSSDNDDKWGAFPGQRKEILDVIFSNRIPNVVVLSGDVHASFSCTLRHRLHDNTWDDFEMHTVVSSSFFWPYPHMARSSFLFDRSLSNMGMRDLVPQLRSGDTYGDDNFTRLDARPSSGSGAPTLSISVYQRKGDALETGLRLF